jgi:esterase/lipase superfamily enzyme
MRLMVPPLIFQDIGTGAVLRPAAGLNGAAPVLADGSRIAIFYATNRLPVGPLENRIYTVAPDRRLHVGTATLRIGDEGTTLTQIWEWSTRAEADDRPYVHLERMAERAALPDALHGDPGTDGLAWFAEVEAALAASASRNIVIYVHGANTTVERAAGQASQLAHFSGRQAVVVLFAWPTAENFLRYPRDIRNAFGAAPHLAELVALLAAHTSAARIDVMTYSAGATVGSEGLALLARGQPDAAARLGEVYHAAPDADFRAFVEDMRAYAGPAERVTTAANLGDSALRLAAVVNRASRAGRPDLRELSDEAADWVLSSAGEIGAEVIHIDPGVLPATAGSSHTFWYDDPWVSSDLLAVLLFRLPAADRGLVAGTAPGGATYWSFPPDFPARVAAMQAALIAWLKAGGTR